MKVCISVKELYNKGSIDKGTIIPDFEDGEMAYYDLYNEDGELACLDGECVEVISNDNNTVVLENQNGLENIRFTLTAEEYGIATFKNS